MMGDNRRIAIAKKFLRAVWGGDLAVNDALMSEEVVFVDSCGERLKGFAECSKAAGAFASLEPDCRVTISEAFERSDVVMLRVELAVTDPRIAGPYLVSLKIADGRVCEWQTHRHNRVPYARVLRRAIAAEAMADESGIDIKPAPR